MHDVCNWLLESVTATIEYATRSLLPSISASSSGTDSPPLTSLLEVPLLQPQPLEGLNNEQDSAQRPKVHESTIDEVVILQLLTVKNSPLSTLSDILF